MTEKQVSSINHVIWYRLLAYTGQGTLKFLFTLKLYGEPQELELRNVKLFGESYTKWTVDPYAISRFLN